TSVNPALVYGIDYAMKLDWDSTGAGGSPDSSRSGLLYRINELWPKPIYAQRNMLSSFVGPSLGNIKVNYTAGYTVDQLPAPLRETCHELGAGMRWNWPLGVTVQQRGRGGMAVPPRWIVYDGSGQVGGRPR